MRIRRTFLAAGSYPRVVPRGSIRFTTLVAGLSAALLAGPVAVPSPSSAAAGPVKILLEGDSITQGFDGDFTWRYRLDKELVRQGVSSRVDLVGSLHGPIIKGGYTSSQYADPSFDSDHFAVGGSTFPYHLARVQDEVAAQQPDVIVLALGVNDLRNGRSPQDTDDSLRQWIGKVRAVKSDVTIIVSPVLDATDVNKPWLPQAIKDFRALEATTVQQLDLPTSHLYLADTNRGWTAQGDTFDNLHPTPTGETLIAQHIAEELHALGYLPQAPDIYRPTPWSRVARTQVRIASGRATLTWDQQALSGMHLQIHRVGSRTTYTSPSLYTGGKMTTGALAPGATYEFRVQFVRMRIATPYGPWVRATVPASVPLPVNRVVVDKRGVHWVRSVGATHYVVRYRKVHSKHWHTRRTHRLAIRVKHVQVAAVRAANRAGLSTARYAWR